MKELRFRPNFFFYNSINKLYFHSKLSLLKFQKLYMFVSLCMYQWYVDYQKQAYTKLYYLKKKRNYVYVKAIKSHSSEYR